MADSQTRTLIIPDVHERLDRLLEIEATYAGEVDRIVMSGDFFDTHATDKAPREIAEWILAHIDDPKFTLLIGNHDCHYAFDNAGFQCSGYRESTKDIVRELLPRDAWEKFHLFTRVGPYLVSHAGFHEGNIFMAKPEIERDAIKTALDGGFHEIFVVGRCRGGTRPVGGCTWLDWNWEFNPVGGFPQIVGHTVGKEVRKRFLNSESSFCLDTGLNHIAIVTGKDVEIVAL